MCIHMPHPWLLFRDKHNMPISPPIMLCWSAQPVSYYSFPVATYYAQIMLTYSLGAYFLSSEEDAMQCSSSRQLRSILLWQSSIVIFG